MFEISNLSVILFFTTVVNAVASYIGWQRRKSKSGIYFALGLMGVSIWTLAATLDYASTTLSLKILFSTAEAWAYMIALPLFTVATLSFAGYDHWLDKRWIKTLFVLVPLLNILLVSTNGLHGWVWKDFTPAAGNLYIFEHGHAFAWIMASNYAMVLVMIAALWRVSRKGSEISRRQGKLLLFALLFPLLANLTYHLQLVNMAGVDWTSITFSVTGILFIHALYGQHMLDLVPIARDKLVSSLSDGMLVLDTQNRIIDANQILADRLEVSIDNLIGKELGDVIPEARSLLKQPLEMELRQEFEIGTTNKRYFDVLISPVRDRSRIVIGRLIIAREVTERKRNELRLRQLTEAVEQSPASVVITDLDGRIEYVNPQFSKLTGYTHDEVIGKNPSILKSGNTPVEVYRDMWESISFQKTWRGEFLNKKKNGDLYWERAVMAPVLDHAGNILNYIAVKEDITERKQAEAALERRFLEIQELHRNLQETQSQLVEQQRTLAALDERKRLGRNMHDSVNQSIHSLMLFSETLMALLEKQQADKAMYVAERILQSATQALKEIRLLVYETQSLPVDQNTDLVSILEERLTMVERRIGIRADLICRNVEQYPHEWNENLYWMITEALNNSLKHAQARTVTLMIGCNENKLEVEINDDGIGFEMSRMKSGGFGMRILCERAQLLGGLITIQSSPGTGTQVRYTAPFGG